MDQELQTLVSNIQAIADQMKQMLAGEGAPAGEAEDMGGDEDLVGKILKAIRKEEAGEDEEKDEMESIEKGDEDADDEDDMVEKDDMDAEAVNANDKAEDRIEELPEGTEDAIQEVAKAIVAHLKKSRSVKKAQPKANKQVAKALAALAKEINEVKKAQVNILEGIGIAEQIKQAYAPRQINSDNSVKKSVDEIRSLLGIEKKEEPVVNHNLQKSLTDNNGAILRAMLSTKNKVKY